MKKSLFTTLILAGLVYSCSPKLTVLTQSDADRMQEKFPGVSLAELQQGKELYEGNCGKCHPLKDPKKFNEEHWKKLVPDMSNKVNRKAGSTVLDKDKEELILKYVLTVRTQP